MSDAPVAGKTFLTLCQERVRLFFKDKKAANTIGISLLLILSYTQFYPPLVHKLLTIKIAPYLKIGQSITTDLVFGIFFTVGIVLLCKRIKPLFSKPGFSCRDLFWPVIILIIYSLHRTNQLNTNPWFFENFQLVPIFRYADSAILLLLAVVYKPREYLTPTDIIPEYPTLIEDDLISGNRGTDVLKRGAYAHYIAQLIMNLETIHSFAIGVKGSWGSGKSVFIWQIESQLPNVIKIRFNPWLCKKEDDVMTDFFKVLIEKTSVYNNDLSRKLKRYYSTLANLDENFGKKVLSTFGIINNKEIGLEEQQDDIAELLKNNKLKLVIFIDDLDRLHAIEVLNVFRLIRNSLNFPNTVFLIAYDERYVTEILEKQMKRPEKFIEKIFQLEIDLPGVPSIVIEQQLENLLIAEKTQGQIDKIRSGLRLLKDTKITEQAIQNIRDAIRFSNAVNHLFWKKEKEIDVHDFMLLELLKLKSRTIFHELRNALINGPDLEYLRKPTQSFSDNSIFTISDLEEPKHASSLERYIVQTLFNRQDYFDEVKSIRFVGNAIRYFSDDLFGNISYADFDRFKESSFDAFKTLIDKQFANNNIEELANKMLRLNTFPDYSSFFNVNKGLLYISYLQKNYRHTDIVYNHLKRNFTKLKDSIQESGKFDEFIRNLLTNNNTEALEESKVLGSMLHMSVTSVDKIDYPKDQIISLLLYNLKQFIKKNDGSFNRFVFDIYYELYNKVDDSTIIILTEANELLRNYVGWHLDSFFTSWLIRPKLLGNIDSDLFVLEPFINQYLGNAEFEKLLYEQKPKVDVLQLQGFYEKLKASGYKEARHNRKVLEVHSNRNTMFVKSSNGTQITRRHSREESKKQKYSAAITELEGATWITGPFDLTEAEAISGGTYVFERLLDLSETPGNIKRIILYCLVDDYLQLSVNGIMLPDKANSFMELHKFDLENVVKKEITLLKFYIENAASNKTDLQGNPNSNPYEFIYTLLVEWE